MHWSMPLNRSKQRGATIWMYALAALLLIGALTGLVVAWNHYTDGLDKRGYDRGIAESTAAYTTRDNKALADALARTKTLEEAARATERGHVAALATVEKQRLEALANGETAEKRVLARIESGDLVLRPGAFTAGACPTVSPGSQVSPAVSSTAGTAGAGNCGLSPDAERRVLAIGKDANRVRDKLTACQQVIAEDRRVCGQ